MPHVELNDARLHYRWDGPEHAPALLLANSLGTDLNLWQAQIDVLAERYRVLRYDCRGHGQSDVTPGPYTMDQLGRDALALLDIFKVDRAHFCGISMGGMIGMWLAIHAADRIDRLVLCNTSAYIGPPSVWDSRIEAVEQGGMEAVVDAVLGRWFTSGYRSQTPAAVEQVRAMLLATPPQGYAACSAAIRDMDQRESVSAIDRPTLVITGTDDQSTPPSDGQYLVERIKGAEYQEFDVAHLSNIEQSQRFTDTVLNFLGRESG